MTSRYGPDENTPPDEPDNPADRLDRNSYGRRYAHLRRAKLLDEADAKRRAEVADLYDE